MSESFQPDLLLVAKPSADRDRWSRTLGATFRLRLVDGFDAVRALDDAYQPDICAVDVDMSTNHGESVIVALRGIYAAAEFVAIGTAPRIESLIASVNEAQIRRYLAMDSTDEAILETLRRVWREGKSIHLLRRRINDVVAERDRLLVEQTNLMEKLLVSDREVAESTDRQQQIRDKLEDLLYPSSVRSPFPNCLTFPMLKIRIREEVEKYQRYGHPFAIMMLELELPASAGEEQADMLRKRLEWVVASKVRHIDLVATDPPSRMVVLMPVTELKKAEVASLRLSAAIAEAKLPLNATIAAVMSYPQDKARVAHIE